MVHVTVVMYCLIASSVLCHSNVGDSRHPVFHRDNLLHARGLLTCNASRLSETQGVTTGSLGAARFNRHTQSRIKTTYSLPDGDSTSGDQAAPGAVFVIVVYCVIPISLFDTSNPTAIAIQSSVLLFYGAVCVIVWRTQGKRKDLRLWLPLGYFIVVLTTNLALLGVAIAHS